MKTLLETTLERSVDTLVAQYQHQLAAGDYLSAWVFDDLAARQAAERALAAHGIQAHFLSAYKPLVHFFIETLGERPLHAIHIRYPAPKEAPQRFLLEAYPLAGLIKDAVTLTWEAVVCEAQTALYYYELTLTHTNGKLEHIEVAAPNRCHIDHVDTQQLSPCGWVQWRTAQGESASAFYACDYAQLFELAMQTVTQASWPAQQPLFEELNISVNLPCQDTLLPFGKEHISLAEGLHEDLYFSLLEYYQHLAGLPLGDRSIQPGQIVPEIRTRIDAPPSISITLRPLCTAQAQATADIALIKAPRAPGVQQITNLLEAIDGDVITAKSRSGRILSARYRKGNDRAVIISAAQHANETSGIVGALRAGRELASRPTSHFVLSPLENPDGYHLQQRLVAEQPTHMHHAARYTAFGNDLQAQPINGDFELAIRERAKALSGADLHINLHGYPAHEWTRPLTGYVPRNFELWSIPKGFFLIMRYHQAWEIQAKALLTSVTQHLATVPGLVDYNLGQIDIFEAHAGRLEFDISHGIPYLLTRDDDQLTPLQLITEYPDETIYDADFIMAHQVQYETIMSAYRYYQAMTLSQ
ncbi:peptidase M14 [Vreelandella zhanjiangensis]|uniref:peptidase M14 n=1 Tax=Vreelandella zhanjiangensis TaxID=1121960 RepID=UPI00402A7DB3